MLNVMDAYWKVGSRSDVYHSKRNIYVPTSDADFVARGAQATPILNEAEIWDQVQTFMPWWLWNGITMAQPAEGQYSKDQLKNYNAQVRLGKVTGGIKSGNVPIKTDDRSRGFVHGAVVSAQSDQSFATTWYGADGNFYQMNASQVQRMGDDLSAHTNQCYDIFADTSTKIDAGQITTLDKIDQAYKQVMTLNDESA